MSVIGFEVTSAGGLTGTTGRWSCRGSRRSGCLGCCRPSPRAGSLDTDRVVERCRALAARKAGGEHGGQRLDHNRATAVDVVDMGVKE
jgi:hypothetical protein